MDRETIFKNAKNEFCLIAKNSNYKILGEYLGTSKKIEVECPANHKWAVTPSHFKRGVRCPKCRNRCPKKAEEKFLNELMNDGYVTKDKYEGNKTKVKVKCPKNHSYSVRPNDFMMGHRCRKCSADNNIELKNRKLKSFENLKEIAKNRKYEIMGEYINTKTKIKLKCPKGHINLYNIDHFKKGFGCSICSNLDKETSKNELIELANKEGYEVLGDYINVMTKIDLKCPNGHMYAAKPNCFKNGNRCPKCNNQSFGEEKAIDILVKNKIKFKVQKTFPNLIGIGGGRLRFDIYIPSKKSIIEIQGEQHFDKDNFYANNTMEHDEIKRKYCKDNKIKLFEVIYSPNKLGKKKAIKEVEKDIFNIIETLDLAKSYELQRSLKR